MQAYRVQKVHIGERHPLYGWCHQVTALANNLSNAVRFRQRQLLTASRKEEGEWTGNEKEVIQEFRGYLGEEAVIPSSPGYKTIYNVLYATGNPDYFAKGLPKQSAQGVIQKCVQDMDSYFALMKRYQAGAGDRPSLPGYKRKGGHTSVYVSNQDCTIRQDGKGGLLAGLPFAKKTPLRIGNPAGCLKQVEVCPDHRGYMICFTFEVTLPDTPLPAASSRIAAIDFGVNNLMAVTNNCGLPLLLYKGGIVKSVNQYYNKRIAAAMAEEMAKPDCPKNRKGIPRFIPTPESKSVTFHRNQKIQDFMHKAAKHLLAWCVENRIDTIVAGVNPGWKQGANLGKVNNQNFVQIPFAYLRHCIQYQAEVSGILYLEQEESYTSRASFLDGDPIPTYGVDDKDAGFSGKRGPSRYAGMYKKDGFRGLYRTADGTFINADLNGSANILRKAFPDAFLKGSMPDFTDVVIVKDPDREFIAANQREQAEKRQGHHALSHAKASRLRRKLAS